MSTCGDNSCTVRLFLIYYFLVAMISACAPPLWKFRYKGDGTFVDHGPRAAINRYVLDLGPIGDSKERLTFELGCLPPGEDLTLGLFANGSEAKSDRTRIRIYLFDEHRRLLLHDEGCLSDWWWSGGPARWFVYGRRDEVDKATGYVNCFATTILTPVSGKRYTLDITILERDPDGASLRLQIRGGGWK